MIYIYVLLLENSKYYIGKTSNPKFRIENHFDNNGAEWTKMHKPIKVLKIIPNCDNYDEDKYTLKYMDKYGIDNVRGGSYTSIILNNSIKNHLIKISNNANNRCFKCGKQGHFAKDCNYDDDDYSYNDEKNNNDSDNDNDNDSDNDSDNDNYSDDDNDDKYSNHICFRCGRNGHYASSCYASKHIKGYNLK
jgi:cellular nucleic acid-binding protein